MKCPYCQNECVEGIAESTDLNFMSKWKINVLWYPSQEEGKLLKKDLHSMPRKTKAYYCHQCRKVFAEYDVYPHGKTENS